MCTACLASALSEGLFKVDLTNNIFYLIQCAGVLYCWLQIYYAEIKSYGTAFVI